jgi:hypothetical protein
MLADEIGRAVSNTRDIDLEVTAQLFCLLELRICPKKKSACTTIATLMVSEQHPLFVTSLTKTDSYAV